MTPSSDGGRYSRVARETQPASTRPTSGPNVELRGATWRVGVPAVVLTSLVSAFGARALPTPTASDRALEQIESQLQTRALRAELSRAEVRRELAALREQIATARTASTSQFAQLDARLSRLERRAPK